MMEQKPKKLASGKACLIAFLLGALAGVGLAVYAKWVTTRFPGQQANGRQQLAAENFRPSAAR